MVDKAKKSFRPLTGNHLVNLTRKDVKENSGIILFPSPYGESFSKSHEKMAWMENTETVSVPLRGII